MKKCIYLLFTLAVILDSCGNSTSEKDRYINDLMGKMTLREKLGQMNLPMWDSKAMTDSALVSMAKTGSIGGLWNFNGNADANPRNFEIVELEAAQLPLALPDVDASVINGNYALGAGLPASHPALLVESFDAETSIRRTNFIVVTEGNENSEKINALIEAITSDAVAKYIEDTYKGAVITSFVDPQ